MAQAHMACRGLQGWGRFGLGRASSIDKRLPETVLQEPSGHAADSDQEGGPFPITHQTLPSEYQDDCKVLFIPIDVTNYVEYRVAPSGQWFASPVCDDVICNLLCGEHNQFQQWLTTMENVAINPVDECSSGLKHKVMVDGPPLWLSGEGIVPMPPGGEGQVRNAP
jgi:hypothetical protein